MHENTITVCTLFSQPLHNISIYNSLFRVLDCVLLNDDLFCLIIIISSAQFIRVHTQILILYFQKQFSLIQILMY